MSLVEFFPLTGRKNQIRLHAQNIKCPIIGDEKYGFVKKVLWQESGKFVGLDHEIPLGDNGITLTSAKGL